MLLRTRVLQVDSFVSDLERLALILKENAFSRFIESKVESMTPTLHSTSNSMSHSVFKKNLLKSEDTMALNKLNHYEETLKIFTAYLLSFGGRSTYKTHKFATTINYYCFGINYYYWKQFCSEIENNFEKLGEFLPK